DQHLADRARPPGLRSRDHAERCRTVRGTGMAGRDDLLPDMPIRTRGDTLPPDATDCSGHAAADGCSNGAMLRRMTLTAADPMIEVVEVVKRDGRSGGGAEALLGVSLTPSAGPIWAVVGPNGAGKSTLLSVLLGFIRPTAGEVIMAGEKPR